MTKMFENVFGTIPKFLIRKNAPETSVEAGNTVDSTTLEKVVYNTIKGFPDGCISDDVLEALKPLPYGSITGRYAALKRKGLVVTTDEKRLGKAGKPQYVMRAV